MPASPPKESESLRGVIIGPRSVASAISQHLPDKTEYRKMDLLWLGDRIFQVQECWI